MSDTPQPPLPENPVEVSREPFWSYTDVLLFIVLAMPCMLLGYAASKFLMFLLRQPTTIRAIEVLAAQLAGRRNAGTQA